MKKIKRVFSLIMSFFKVSLNLIFKKRELNTETVICLTSYKSRINQSFFTLLSLLGQNKLYRIYLFIAEDDKSYIGSWLLWLEKRNYYLNIVFTDDVRSYKKLLPILDHSLIHDPKLINSITSCYCSCSYIMTADDDIFYSADTVESMMVHGDDHTVVFNVGRELNTDNKYYELSTYIPDKSQIVNNVLPIGAGGILYPKALLKHIQTNDYMKLAPTCDDIWFYSCLMEHTNYKYNADASYFKLSKLVGQKESLLDVNLKSNNDKALTGLVFSKKGFK